jgi:hypothetical protein
VVTHTKQADLSAFDFDAILPGNEPSYFAPFPESSRTCNHISEESAELSDGPKYEIAEIFRHYDAQYREAHSPTVEQLSAMHAIENCRTSVYGFHADVCDECGHIERAYNSCRNRHCPKCQGIAKRLWVRARMDQLLPIPYYHCVFTLPNLIFPLSLYNQKLIYDLLFECASQTLLVFAADERWLGAEIGFYGILHTWSQTLWGHPHIHFIVTGGGLNIDGEWVDLKYKGKFLFPVCAMSKVFRGKFVEGLKRAFNNGELTFPDNMNYLNRYDKFEKWIDRFVRRNWVVHTKAPFAGPEEVVQYIGRYTHRVAISNSRIKSIDDGKIRFSYKDRKNGKGKAKWREMTLPADKFIQRFLWRILPNGYHRIRHYGFLANGKAKKKTEEIRRLLSDEDFTRQHHMNNDLTETQAAYSDDDYAVTCPICKKGKLRPFYVVTGYGKVIKNDPTLIADMIHAHDTS